MRCRSGDVCLSEAVEGERFCAQHLEVIRRIGQSFREEDAQRGGLRSRPAVRPPTCRAFECVESRRPGSSYCTSHAWLEKVA